MKQDEKEKSMKVALIQADLIWEDAQQNRKNFETKIYAVASDVDLIVLPEMFTTGFTMHPEGRSETMEGETIRWMTTLASSHAVAITGSLIIKENNQFYNRLVFVFPNGNIRQYDKRHLFSLAGEDKTYTAGKQKLLIEYNGWKICPLICYDLRFPVFSRNVEDYDLLLYVANWPKTRITAWDVLLKARAVENMCYAIGVNRIGADENDLQYCGHSQVVDFLGHEMVTSNEEEDVFTAILNRDEMLETRSKLGFLNDRDDFKVILE